METSQNPLVSIIIPCFNVEVYILECLHSSMAQSYFPLEIIVVDNNCTDKTISLVKKFAAENQQEIKIVSEKKQILSCARNAGLAIARGSWIQFLDADDLLLPGKLEHQIKLTHSDVGFIAGATFERDLEGNEHVETPHENTMFGLMIGHRGCGSSCSNLWNTSVLKELGGFCEEQIYGQEYELMQRIYEQGYKIVKDNLPLTIIRKRHFGQMSQSNHPVRYLYYLKIIERQILYFKHNPNWPLERTLMIKLFKSILYRLSLQSLEFAQESSRQFHTVFLPVFASYSSCLTLKDKIKIRMYNMFGYENVRKLLNKRVQWSQ